MTTRTITARPLKTVRRSARRPQGGRAGLGTTVTPNPPAPAPARPAPPTGAARTHHPWSHSSLRQACGSPDLPDPDHLAHVEERDADHDQENHDGDRRPQA